MDEAKAELDKAEDEYHEVCKALDELEDQPFTKRCVKLTGGKEHNDPKIRRDIGISFLHWHRMWSITQARCRTCSIHPTNERRAHRPHR